MAKVTTTQEALEYVMPFGKHKSKKLYTIADTDPLYLDWAAEEFDDRGAGTAIRLAILDKTVADQIRVALEEKDNDD